MKFNRDYNKQLPGNGQALDTVNVQDYRIATNEIKPIAAWRLWVPLLIQMGLILSVPAQPIYTQLTGKTVVLRTVPVDPYDLFRGYSVRLNYDISRLEDLRHLSGWAELVRQNPGSTSYALANGSNFYVILEQPKQSASSLPEAWKPVGVSSDRPASVAANQVALKGRYIYGSIAYGLETYYIPEEQREQINNDINQAQQFRPGQQRQEQPIVVEVKVDAQGNAVPLSFWVSDPQRGLRLRNYRF